MQAVVGGFTPGNVFFLVMNRDNAGQGRHVMTNTSHMSSCIVMLKDVIKVSLFQKEQTI
jgi:hypothetical protein